MVESYSSTEDVAETGLFGLYRARSEQNRHSVLLKTPLPSAPESLALLLLEHEFELLQAVSCPGVVRALELRRNGVSWALVLEDNQAVPLAAEVNSHLGDLTFFFRVALQLASTLAELHRRGVSHPLLAPYSVLLKPDGGVELWDLSLVSRALEPAKAQAPLLARSLPYISPEQTGRMNRPADYRSDFYSLGALFYELLIGVPPFVADDELELIHKHLAKTPEDPTQLSPHIPATLSQLVLKLLAKSPDERYQSDHGLIADLEACARQWEKNGIVSLPALGLRDLSDRFNIPQRLYGRDEELAQLLRSFNLTCEGPTMMLLVAGYSGIGKTSLIQELYRPIAQQRGFFIAGKFDQVVRDLPYGALVQAFRGFASQLLTRSDEELQAWRHRLMQALGNNAGVITEVLPEIELILGAQRKPTAVGPSEGENRFRNVFQLFLAAIARREHPLVIFLDDLQWADSATLSLLQPLLTSPQIQYLFLIGAYRDNEVDAAHPLTRQIKVLQNCGARLVQLTLGPLRLPDLTHLIGDCLHREESEVEALAGLTLTKTDGNPFFVIEFLKTLHHENLVRFDYDQGVWVVDIESIQAVGITDNVVDLMTRKILRLGQQTQNILRLAACIGNEFDVPTLSTVSELKPDFVRAFLGDAARQGLVVPATQPYGWGSTPASDGFVFLHDRVQQAAYGLIPRDHRESVHLRVGRLLLKRGEAAEEKLFDTVHHLNLGSRLIEDEAELLDLARLNLAAGRKAKSAAAFQLALGYLLAGIRLLNETHWGSRYDLAFPLHLDTAECQYLCGQFPEAERTFGLLLERAKTRLDKAEVFRLWVLQYENMSEYARAVEVARRALALFDVTLPEHPSAIVSALEDELRQIESFLSSRPIESLIDLPRMKDDAIRMVMKLLTCAWAPAYVAGDVPLTRLISAVMVRLSLLYGNTEESAYGYVTHAITVGTVKRDYESGHAFGNLAIAVNDIMNDTRHRAKVHHMFSCFVKVWRKPMATCFRHSQEAWKSGLETGDFAYANYGAFHESWYALLTSRNLDQFLEDYAPNIALIRRIKMESFIDAQMVILNWARALKGQTKGSVSLTAGEFDEDRYAAVYKDSPFFMTFLLVARLHLNYLFERYAEAAELSESARRAAGALEGTIWPVLVDFFGGLTETMLLAEASGRHRETLMRRLCERQEKLSIIAANSPENFLCYSLLLDAQIESQDRHQDAIDRYEEAARYAQQTQSIAKLALANELFGKFWLRRKNEPIAALYLRKACSNYHDWGAAAKVHDLRERYGPLLVPTEAGYRPSSSLFLTRPPSAQFSPDMVTVLKAARAISLQMDRRGFLTTLLKITMETSGAQKGVFLEQIDGRLLLQADVKMETGEISVLQGTPVEQAFGFAHAVVRYVRKTGKRVTVREPASDEKFSGDPYVVKAQPRAIFCMPVFNQRKLVGILYLENSLTPDAFNDETAQTLGILGSQAAISLENTRLYENARQEAERRRYAEERNRTLLAVSNSLISNLKQEDLLPAITEALDGAVSFDLSAIFLCDPQKNVLRLFTVHPREHGQLKPGLETGMLSAPLLLRGDLRRDKQYPLEYLLASDGMRSSLFVPLPGISSTTGFLMIASRFSNHYRQEDAELLQDIGKQTALAVSNMRAYEEIAELKRRLEKENLYLQEEIERARGFEEILGTSPAMVELFRKIEKVAGTDTTILITGETGTGKELVARAIHRRSTRSERPLIRVNCAAIASELFESELFGHLKGAFTGAHERRIGRFELADQGTIFLDEIGELPVSTQSKLLRVLQEQEFEPVGSSRPVRVDVRVIAATNRDLEHAVAKGRFRSDLFFRLNVLSLQVPPLRERASDIPLLMKFFVQRYSRKTGRKIKSITQQTIDHLMRHTWPGNVRELQNVVERAVVLSAGGVLDLDRALDPPREQTTSGLTAVASAASDFPNLFAGCEAGAWPSLEEIEARYMKVVIQSCEQVIEGSRGAARILGMHPSTLRSRMRKLGITRRM